MANEQLAQMVPDQITGAQTTDFAKYVGQVKYGANGYAAVLGVNVETVSVAQYQQLSYDTGTATVNVQYRPHAYGTIVAQPGNVGVAAQSAPANGLIWKQTAGTITGGFLSSAATRAPRANHFVATAGGAFWVTAATSGANATFTTGIAAVNVNSIAISATSAILQLVPWQQ